MTMRHADILAAVATYLETLSGFGEASVVTTAGQDREFSLRVLEFDGAEERTQGLTTTSRRMRFQIRTQYAFEAGTERELHVEIMDDQATIEDQLPKYLLNNAIPCACLPDGPRRIEPVRSGDGAYSFVSIHPWVATYLEEQTS